jgi:hypothetical protein
MAPTFKQLVSNLIGLVNYIFPLLVGAALLLFFWGIVKYMYKSSEGERADSSLFFWGLLALFVLVSLWGIINLMRSAFLG